MSIRTFPFCEWEFTQKHLSWHREQCYFSVVTAIWSWAFTFIGRDYYALVPFLWSIFLLLHPNNDLVQCMHWITSTVLDVFWIDTTWSWCHTRFYHVHGFVCFHDCGWRGVNERICCGCSCFWKQRHLGEVVKAGLIKCWGTLATLPQQIPSDNSFPFADLSGADKVTDFCISCQKLANASLILPQRRWFSPARATAPPIGFCRVWEISSAVQLIACTPLYLPPTKKELFQIIPMHMITREIIPGRKTEGSTVSSINCGRSSLI